jgi:hypothetical protein
MSLFENFPKKQPKIKVGYPCQNCPHTHADHSMYGPKLCVFDEECHCPGLKLPDVKTIKADA